MYSQLRDVPLEVKLFDSEAARQRLEELSVTHVQTAAVNRTLRSNRFVYVATHMHTTS